MSDPRADPNCPECLGTGIVIFFNEITESLDDRECGCVKVYSDGNERY